MAESESETENEREREREGARLLHTMHAGRAGEHASERGRHTALRPYGRSAIAAAQLIKTKSNTTTNVQAETPFSSHHIS